MIIKSSDNLCKDYDAFSDFAHSIGEPIFITRDGEGDTVLMSIELYNRFIAAKSYVGTTSIFTEKTDMQKGSNDMSEFKLGRVLRALYDDAPRGLQVACIHVFSIYFAEEIEKNRLSKKEILKSAGLPESYQTEISKGVNLAQYVSVKEQMVEHLRKLQSECM